MIKNIVNVFLHTEEATFPFFPIKMIYNTSLRSSFASDALTHSYGIMGVHVLI